MAKTTEYCGGFKMDQIPKKKSDKSTTGKRRPQRKNQSNE